MKAPFYMRVEFVSRNAAGHVVTRLRVRWWGWPFLLWDVVRRAA